MAAPVEILLRAGVEPNTTLVENPYFCQNSCQMRSDGKTRKITAIKLLNSIGGRHIGAREDSRRSAREVYLHFVRIRKRNIAATFAKPRADNLRALGSNGSGRGLIRPYRAEASKVTQTAIMAHKGNQNTVLLTHARSLGLSVCLTDPFYDIDVAADLGRLAEELQIMPARAPKTAKWLSDWASAAHD